MSKETKVRAIDGMWRLLVDNSVKKPVEGHVRWPVGCGNGTATAGVTSTTSAGLLAPI